MTLPQPASPTQVIEHLHEELRAYAWRIGEIAFGHRDEGEAFLLDSLTLLHWRLSTGRMVSNDRLHLARWVRKAVRQHAFNERRKRARATDVVATLAAERFVTAGEDADDPACHAECEETCRMVQKLVKHLPVRARRVVELHWFERLSWPEVASALGSSIGVVRGLHGQALRSMRSILCESAVCRPIDS